MFSAKTNVVIKIRLIKSDRPPPHTHTFSFASYLIKLFSFLGGDYVECLPFYGNVTALLSHYIASLSHITQVIATRNQPTFVHFDEIFS